MSGLRGEENGEGVLCWCWGGKGESVAAEEGGKGEWVWVWEGGWGGLDEGMGWVKRGAGKVGSGAERVRWNGQQQQQQHDEASVPDWRRREW